MPENCKACGLQHKKTEMVDVVITARDENGGPSQPFIERWDETCAKESEGKPWFAYAKDVDMDEVRAKIEARRLAPAITAAGGAVEAGKMPDGQHGVIVKGMDKVWANTRKASEDEAPKPKKSSGKSGWEGMKKALPNLEAAQKKLEEAKAKGMSAGYIRLLERLVGQYKDGTA